MEVQQHAQQANVQNEDQNVSLLPLLFLLNLG